MPNQRQAQQTPWHRDPVILERLAKVDRLRLHGWPNTRIAAHLDVDEATIRRDRQRLEHLWRERIQDQQVNMRAEIVAKLEDTRLRALDAAEWDQECEAAVLYGEASPDGKGGTRRVYRDDKGAAQYRGQKAQSLNVARQSAMDQAKVLGVIVEKVAPTDADGNTLDLVTLLQLARAQREPVDGQ